jgi:hypothetical protein
MCRDGSAAHTNASSVRDRLATGNSKPTSGQDAVKSLAQLARTRSRKQTHRRRRGGKCGGPSLLGSVAHRALCNRHNDAE